MISTAIPPAAFRRLPKSRYLMAIVILAGGVWAATGLTRRLTAEYFRYRADVMVDRGRLGLAAEAMRKAVERVPRDAGLHKSLASVYHRMGQSEGFPRQNRMWAQKARAAYAEAFRLNPLDAEAAVGMAREASWAEQLRRALEPNKSPGRDEALPYFQTAISLRPNGIPFHFELIGHLHRMGNTTGEAEAVERLCRIYPAAYELLHKSPYWGDATRPAASRGLAGAVKEGTSLQTAHFALSAIAAEERRWVRAAAEYEKALAMRSGQPTGAENAKLGTFYLRAGDLDRAGDLLLQSLAGSRNLEKDLTHIYRVYAQAGYGGAFQRFYARANRRFSMPARTGIVLARAQLADGDFVSARRILENLNAAGPSAEAWYGLFRVAEAEKDPDRMELAIQRATVLDPDNAAYRRHFIELLKKRGKYRTAESQIDRLLAISRKPSAPLFAERAELRYQQGNLTGAAEDRLAAARLTPARADLWARAGEAQARAGDWRGALESYGKAAKLSPKNDRYRKQLRRLGQGG